MQSFLVRICLFEAYLVCKSVYLCIYFDIDAPEKRIHIVT